MDNIVAIMDMDGFTVNKQFLCRELGLIKHDEETAKSYDFNIDIRWSNLSPKDLKNCLYVGKYIHKLPLVAARGSLPLSKLDTIVKDFYYETKDTEKSAIAYKGGCLERNLLTKLNIPNVNLECFGCPKAELLFDNLIWLETCGQHFGKDTYKHCPKVEVEAFCSWLKKNKKSGGLERF